MKTIYIQDRNGYVLKRINNYLNRKLILKDFVYLNENDLFHYSDSSLFIFVINSLEDFFYFVQKYRSLDQFKFLLVDSQLAKELKKNNIEYFTFLSFYNFINEDIKNLE